MVHCAGLTSTITIEQVLTRDSLLKMGDRCSTQLAKMSIDPKLVELAADIVRTTL